MSTIPEGAVKVPGTENWKPCQAETLGTGQPCRGPATASGYCPSHDPELLLKRKATWERRRLERREERTLDPAKRRTISEQECVETGGHCWVEDTSPFVTIPFPDAKHKRFCKHCGLVQVGVEQEPVKWADADA